MNQEETIVYNLIKEGKITQRQIMKSASWLGCHPVHEDEIGLVNKDDTTLRKIRQIIRNLRINHNVLILSDVKGYWIPETEEEIQEYLERMEATAKAQAKAWYETYRAMRHNFKIKSEYFEQQLKLFPETETDGTQH